MAFCCKCGAKLEDGDLFCENCGYRNIELNAQAGTEPASAQGDARPEAAGSRVIRKTEQEIDETGDIPVNRRAASQNVSGKGKSVNKNAIIIFAVSAAAVIAIAAVVLILFVFPGKDKDSSSDNSQPTKADPFTSETQADTSDTTEETTAQETTEETKAAVDKEKTLAAYELYLAKLEKYPDEIGGEGYDNPGGVFDTPVNFVDLDNDGVTEMFINKVSDDACGPAFYYYTGEKAKRLEIDAFAYPFTDSDTTQVGISCSVSGSKNIFVISSETSSENDNSSRTITEYEYTDGAIEVVNTYYAYEKVSNSGDDTVTYKINDASVDAEKGRTAFNDIINNIDEIYMVTGPVKKQLFGAESGDFYDFTGKYSSIPQNAITYDEAVAFLKKECGISESEAAETTAAKETAETTDAAGKTYTKNTYSAANTSVPDITKYNVGDTIYFGSIDQDNNEANGKEAIEWEIIYSETDNYLLVSKYALAVKPYGDKETAKWDTASLRTWLNNDFYNGAFNSKEQALMVRSLSTEDMVSVLTYDSTDDSGISYFYREAEKRVCCLTDSAIQDAMDAGSLSDVCDSDYKCKYWCRNGAVVTASGSIDETEACTGLMGVRPIIWVKAK